MKHFLPDAVFTDKQQGFPSDKPEDHAGCSRTKRSRSRRSSSLTHREEDVAIDARGPAHGEFPGSPLPPFHLSASRWKAERQPLETFENWPVLSPSSGCDDPAEFAGQARVLVASGAEGWAVPRSGAFLPAGANVVSAATPRRSRSTLDGVDDIRTGPGVERHRRGRRR